METKLLATDRPVSLKYALLTDIESVTIVNTTTRSVVFKNGKGWNSINTTIGSIDLQEVSEEKGAGSIFKTTLAASSPGHEENTPDHVANVSGRKALLCVEYLQGKVKLIGNLTSAPKITIRISSGISTVRKIESDWQSQEPNYWLL